MPQAEQRSERRATSPRETAPAQKIKPKRAIALGGGGPVAGLHIGVLEYLKQQNIEFDVWALSCIGAWVGIIYNTRQGDDAPGETYEFFRENIFRDDYSYSVFPINRVFGPDWSENYLAMTAFLTDWDNYKNLWPKPNEIKESIARTVAFWTDPSKWTSGDFNQWMLNDVLAMSPVTRFWTSLMYLSHVNGLSKIYYPNSSFLKSLRIESLKKKDIFMYHNAWDLTEQKLKLFYNKDPEGGVYPRITPASLCACSALPFVESTVDLPDNHTYCEGALVDTVNFKNLLEDHFDLEEVWISRVVDSSQVRKPMNLHDSLGNLCELFAATVGDDDVKLFKYHVQYDDLELKGRPGRHKWEGIVVEIPVSADVTFKWDHMNLEAGRDHGKEEAKQAYDAYNKYIQENPPKQLKFINEWEKIEAQKQREWGPIKEQRRRGQNPYRGR